MLDLIKKKVSPKLARNGFIAISIIALVYHFLVITGVVNYKYAWGGRLENITQMYQFETVSVILLLCFIFFVWVSQLVKKGTTLKMIFKVILFLISGLFLVNTFGNLLAMQLLEAILFTPLTFASFILTFRLAIE